MAKRLSPASGKPRTHGRAFVLLFLLLIVQLLVNAERSNATAAGGSGIEGVISVSPVHGGPSRQGVDDSAPMAKTAFMVEGPSGQVATFTTDEHGKFQVALPPGRYSIRIMKRLMKGTGCGLADIEVTAAGFKKVTLNCDTGMR